MTEKLVLDYENFENSLLSQDFDKRGGVMSFSEYINKNSNCICIFNETDNQEDMSDDSWTLTFKDTTALSNFCEKYNFIVENNLLVKIKNSKKLKK